MDNAKGIRPKKNDIVELSIDATGSKGEGIGRLDGMAVFVPAAAEGDTIQAKLVKVDKRMAYARLERIISPSPYRIEPDCPVFPQCGGCVFRHISYDFELKLKLRRVTDALERIGGVTVKPEGIEGSDYPDRYRNKAQYPCQQGADGKPHFGFYAERSHRLIECDDCRLQPKSFSKAMAAVIDYMVECGVSAYDESTGKGTIRHLYLRRSWEEKTVMVCLVATSEHLPHEDRLIELLRKAVPEVATVLVNVNKEDTNVVLGSTCRTLFGEGFISDAILGVSFRISPLSFFQVNRDGAEKLYSIAAEFADLTGSECLLDMYCGAGTIGLTMAHRVRQLIGVEICEPAVIDARENARLAGITNAEFICADAAMAAKMLSDRGVRPDVIVVDPPRKGCSPELLETMSTMQPKRIVYVSCDPATLARDLKLMPELGYEVQRVRVVDMFPRTGHVECVVLLSKVQK